MKKEKGPFQGLFLHFSLRREHRTSLSYFFFAAAFFAGAFFFAFAAVFFTAAFFTAGFAAFFAGFFAVGIVTSLIGLRVWEPLTEINSL